MFSSPQNIRFICDLDIFEGLSESTLLSLAQETKYQTFTPQEIIYAPKEANRNIYILKEGEIELYHKKDKKNIVFNVLESGDVFGNFNEKDISPTHFARCTRQSQVFIMPLSHFLEVIAGHPVLVLRFFKKIVHRIQDYERKIKSANGDAGEKVLFELNRLREKRSRFHLGRRLNMPLYVTHEVLAKLSGLNRVTVTRTLHNLIAQQKIQINPKTKSIELLT